MRKPLPFSLTGKICHMSFREKQALIRDLRKEQEKLEALGQHPVFSTIKKNLKQRIKILEAV